MGFRSGKAKGPWVGVNGIPGPHSGTIIPAWTSIDLSHTQFQTAALTRSIVVYQLPAGGIIHGVKLKHSVTFDGPAITEYWLSVGFLGDTQALLIEYDVESTAVANDNFAIAQTFDSRNHAAATDVYVSARSVGNNLNTSQQGTAKLWLLVSAPTT